MEWTGRGQYCGTKGTEKENPRGIEEDRRGDRYPSVLHEWNALGRKEIQEKGPRVGRSLQECYRSQRCNTDDDARYTVHACCGQIIVVPVVVRTDRGEASKSPSLGCAFVAYRKCWWCVQLELAHVPRTPQKKKRTFCQRFELHTGAACVHFSFSLGRAP